MKRFLGISLILFTMFAWGLSALDGTVVSVAGKVEVQDGQKWIPLTKGDIVKKGAIISTGFKSEAILKFGESTLTMKPLSRLTLEQLLNLNGNHKTQVYLDVGSIKAKVRAATDKKVGFTVKSPVATASVRGTDFLFDGQNVIVESGVVAITAPSPRGVESDNQQQPTEEEGSTDDTVVSQADLSSDGPGRPILATAGQAVTVTDTGKINTPQQVAINKATSAPSTTNTLSQTETVNTFVPPPPAVTTVVPAGSNTPGSTNGNLDIITNVATGSITVNVSFPTVQ